MASPTDKDLGHKPANFLRGIIERDLEQGTYADRHWCGHPGDAAQQKAGPLDPARIRTRFPPEPNGYLHVGHAKSICLNFGLARDYAGICHLRFDDTNPEKEEIEYVESIKDAVRWLGFDWDANGTSHLYQASDYFDFMYRAAEYLVEAGLAYVDEQTPEEMRVNRGDFGRPGVDSPYRSRSIEENLQRFRDMRDGKLADGAAVLRAKIDMASPNINMRDPTLYRIKHAEHHATADKWSIYPMYTFAHPIEDALENITHSLCTLEFEDQRPFYDWLLDRLGEGGLINTPHPRQYEFARLNLTYVVTSKRKLKQLVDQKYVSGWDDPRMPTIVGLRRRGYTPEAIQLFAERIGVSKADSWIDYSILEGALRDDLDPKAARAMAVLDPVKMVITNWDEVMGAGHLEPCSAPVHPHDADRGRREFMFGRELWVERSDYEETPPKGFFRLFPGNKVRMKYGYVVECVGASRDASGAVTEIQAKLVPDTKSGTPGADSVKVKGNITWVGVADGVKAEVRLYDRLFSVPQPGAGDKDFLEELNPDSLKVVTAYVEPSLAKAHGDEKFQFERHGYFVADRKEYAQDHPVLNLTATLKDNWSSDPSGVEKETIIDLSALTKRIKVASPPALLPEHDRALFLVTSRAAFVDPPLRVIKRGSDTSPFVIVRAPGAVGKSALAQHLAFQKKLPVWDMGKQDLGDHVFVGLLTNAFGDESFSAVMSAIGQGDLPLVVDALDEAEVRSGATRLQNVLVEIAGKVKAATRPVVILFGRTDTADVAHEYLSQLDFLRSEIPVYEISFFGAAKARQLIRTFSNRAVSDTVLNAILERIELALAAVLAIEPERRWEHADFQSFMGYAPVLLAISSLVNQEPNAQKLLNDVSQPEWIAGKAGSSFLYGLIRLLLVREQKKLCDNARAAPEIVAEKVGVDWDTLYTPEEQLTRLAADKFAGIEGYATAAVDVLPPPIRKLYERAVAEFYPQHPFVRSGQFANPIFRDFLLAWAMKNPEFSEDALDYIVSGRISPTAALFSLYTEMPGVALARHAGYLLDSFFAAERGTDSDAQAVAVEGERGKLVLAMWVTTGRGMADARSIALAIDAAGVQFGSKLRSITVSTSAPVTIGDGLRPIELSDVQIETSRLIINGGELNVRGADEVDNVRFAAEDVVTTSHGLVINARAKSHLQISSSAKLQHPWRQYQISLAPAALDDETSSSISAISSILRYFRKHGRAEFARYKDLIDYLVVGKDPTQRKLLEFMKSKGLIQQRGAMYVMTAEKANEFGISWSMSQNHLPNDALLKFAREFGRSASKPNG